MFHGVVDGYPLRSLRLCGKINRVTYYEYEIFREEETMSIELKQTLNDLYLKLEQLKGYL